MHLSLLRSQRIFLPISEVVSNFEWHTLFLQGRNTTKQVTLSYLSSVALIYILCIPGKGIHNQHSTCMKWSQEYRDMMKKEENPCVV